MKALFDSFWAAIVKQGKVSDLLETERFEDEENVKDQQGKAQHGLLGGGGRDFVP
jgi:hypothetical protein